MGSRNITERGWIIKGETKLLNVMFYNENIAEILGKT